MSSPSIYALRNVLQYLFISLYSYFFSSNFFQMNNNNLTYNYPSSIFSIDLNFNFINHISLSLTIDPNFNLNHFNLTSRRLMFLFFPLSPIPLILVLERNLNPYEKFQRNRYYFMRFFLYNYCFLIFALNLCFVRPE
jgi:hypothetical protein